MTLPVRRASATPTMWRPFRGFEDIYSEFDRLVQSLVGGAGSDGAWLPAADVSRLTLPTSSRSSCQVCAVRTSTWNWTATNLW